MRFPAPDPMVLILLAIMLTCMGTGAYVAYKINECSRPGFRPYGCPLVIQIGR